MEFPPKTASEIGHRRRAAAPRRRERGQKVQRRVNEDGPKSETRPPAQPREGANARPPPPEAPGAAENSRSSPAPAQAAAEAATQTRREARRPRPSGRN